MRKICSFVGCQSGTNFDRTRNQAQGRRNPSLFKFPKKNPELRKKWEEVLGREAYDNEVVCELHFSERDLRKDYEVALANGEKFKMERGKGLLDPIAVPRRQVYDNIEERNAKMSKTIHPIVKTEDKNSSKIYIENPLHQRRPETHKTSPESVTIKMETDDCSDTDKENIKIQTKVIVTPPFRAVYHHPFTSNTTDKICSIPRIQPDVKLIPKTENIDIVDEIHEKSPSTLEHLNSQLQETSLPNGWMHILLNNSIIIGHFSDGPAKKEFLIHPEGQVQVYCNKTKVSVMGIHPATTVTDILHNIRILQPLLLCDGVGVDERFCASCEGYVHPTASHRKYGHVRCDPCIKLRHKILRMESKRVEALERLKSDLEKSRKDLKYEKRKRERFEKTAQDAKEESRLIKKRCILIQKAALAGKIQKTKNGCESIFLHFEKDVEEID